MRSPRSSARASTASCSPRPRPTICIITSHDRLEAILRVLTAKAIARAEGVGAEIDVIALAAVRATREAEIGHGGETLEAIIGVPEDGRDDRRRDLRRDRRGRGVSRRICRRTRRASSRATRSRCPRPTTTGASCASVRRSIQRGEPRAAHPARPRAAIPDRGPSGMSERRPRPRAFRLDDERIAVDDAPAPFAPDSDHSGSQNDAIPEPQPASPDRRGRARDRGGADNRVSSRRSRWSLRASSGRARRALVRSRFGLWVTDLIESLFARAAALGWIGVALPRAASSALVGARDARGRRRSIRQTPHRRTARRARPRARRRRSRRGARASCGRLVALYANAPGDGARAGGGPRSCARNHRRARPHRHRRARAAAPARREGARRRSPPPPSAFRWSRRSARARSSTSSSSSPRSSA